MYGCLQVLIKSDKSTISILDYVCTEAKKLTNCGVYYSRHMYFKTGCIPSIVDLNKQLGTYQKNIHYQALYSDNAQQILPSVAESFKSYIALVKAAKKAEVSQKPKLPNYCKSVITVATFTGRSLKLINDVIRFPLGTKVKVWFGLDSFSLPMPSNLDFKSIREVLILPRNKQFYAEFVYQVDEVKSDVDKNNVLGIDHGLNNWLTCVSNLGTSFRNSSCFKRLQGYLTIPFKLNLRKFACIQTAECQYDGSLCA